MLSHNTNRNPPTTPTIMNSLNFAADSIMDLMPRDEVWIGDIPYVADRFARGGMAFVALLRRDDSLPLKNLGFVHGVDVAVKAFLPSDEDPLLRELFNRELTLWAGLNYPTIVKLNEILQTKNDGWVAAMDRCRGSLADVLLARKILPLDEAIFILNDLIQGLAYAANEHKILHLDLKPGNILYGFELSRMMNHNHHPIKQYKWMVSDWGIAGVKDEILARAATSPELKSHHQTFNNLGTQGYMAPERYELGKTSSIASDVFSLGFILVEMMVGTLPLETWGNSLQNQIISGSYFQTAKNLLATKKLPALLLQTILQMIDPVPSRRFHDYEELRSTLLKSAQQSSSLFSRIFKF
jgi:serine/threonine protein kinase